MKKNSLRHKKFATVRSLLIAQGAIPRPRKGEVAKTICGRIIQLKVGESYLASVPLSALSAFADDQVTVSIQLLDERFGWQPIPVACVCGLTKQEAIKFLSRFNNGRVSFRGRKWSAK